MTRTFFCSKGTCRREVSTKGRRLWCINQFRPSVKDGSAFTPEQPAARLTLLSTDLTGQTSA